MKKFYTLILVFVGICASAVMANAATYRSVVFNKTDGEKFALTVESGMTTLVSDGYITMSCDLGVISLATSEVNSWTFSTERGTDFEVAGIGTPEVDQNSVELIVNEGSLTLNGLAAGSKVMLVSVDGRVAASAVAEGSLTLPTSVLNAGVYILTYNDKSIKIALK